MIQEPLDSVTHQYNEAMRELLPQFGIELIEIPRLQLDDGTPINATEVLRCMENGNLQACRNFLTPQRYDYLLTLIGRG